MSKYSILAFGFVLPPESLGSFKSLQKPQAASAHRPWTPAPRPPLTLLISGIYSCTVMVLLIVCLLVLFPYWSEQFAWYPLLFSDRAEPLRRFLAFTFSFETNNSHQLPVAVDERFFYVGLRVFQLGHCSERGRMMTPALEQRGRLRCPSLQGQKHVRICFGLVQVIRVLLEEVAIFWTRTPSPASHCRNTKKNNHRSFVNTYKFI